YHAAVSAAGHVDLARINIPFASIVRHLPLVFHDLTRLKRLGGCIRNSARYFGVKQEARYPARKSDPTIKKVKLPSWKSRFDEDHLPSPAKSGDDEQAMLDEFNALAMDLDESRYACRFEQIKRSKEKAALRRAPQTGPANAGK